MSEVNETLQKIDDFGPMSDLISQIMAIPDEGLTEEIRESLEGMINGAITPTMRKKAVDDAINSFTAQNFTKSYAIMLAKASRQELEDYINDLQPTEQKKRLLTNVIDCMNSILEEAAERYHAYDFDLPIKVGENGHIPTYAHATDAAADIYSAVDMTLAPHSLSNVVSTGLRIALPEGWAAYILPRSSIGMKTGLRLSNSVGVIDSEYRGEIGVMYDNHSDDPYEIHKDDRIAQMIVMPVHQFKPQPVDILSETERGEGGFGSTGK